MDQFEYDVALSFAGEQREEVERVAHCLTSAGVKPFYDKYEKVNLWGKDLYVHLSEVYQHRARYCIVFASKAYSEKIWTNHELRNAQARALTEKGSEYILPVRFDDTAIPGLLSTVSYLEYATEGVEGICAAFLMKLRKEQKDEFRLPSTPLECHNSPLAVLDLGDSRAVFPRVLSCSWGEMIRMSVAGEPDDSLLAQLRNFSGDVIVSFSGDVAVAKQTSVTREITAGKTTWHLIFAPTRVDFSSYMEPSLGGVSADQIAEMRARRLLLNERPYREPQHWSEEMRNGTMDEVLLRGVDVHRQVLKSKFLDLYKSTGRDLQRFLEVSWIDAVTDLKLSATVELISKFSLSIRKTTLSIDFLGKRKARYSNVPAHEIRVQGTLKL